MARAAPGVRRHLEVALQGAWQSRGALSLALVPASWVFGAVAGARRLLHARGHLDVARLPVPVIVVGNLVVGGAGKTPTVIAIVSLLQRHGFTPGIVSRGYGRRAERDVEVVTPESDAACVGDEPLLLRRRTGVPVVVGRDRVAAGHALLAAEPQVDIIVSDDGLQHLALKRDVEVLVFDERGAGNGRLLPAGPLREPLPRSLRAQALVVYNAAAPTTPLPGHLAQPRLAGLVPLGAWWRGEAATNEALVSLRGKEVIAACGVARPQRFFALLRAGGLTIRELALEDHFDFKTLPWPLTAGDVVVTEKDAVKLVPARPIGNRVWVAALDFKLAPAFETALLALVAPAPSRPRD
ncbi:MAG: tetraacyldisaccharide 4'-kinase [Caldimonas sp.]